MSDGTDQLFQPTLEVFVHPTRERIVGAAQLLANLAARVSLHQQSHGIQAVAQILLLMAVVQFLPLLFIEWFLFQRLCAVHRSLPSLYLILWREGSKVIFGKEDTN
jgi:hypothetical protein